MELEKKIIIYFDTNIYDKTSYNFKGQFYTVFEGLKSCFNTNLEIYVDPVTYSEVLSHLKDKAREAIDKFREFKKYTGNIDVLDDIITKFDTTELEKNCFQASKSKFDKFIHSFSTNGIDEKFDNYDMKEILSDYFNCNPPFQDMKRKKHEFPDAFIIQRLKQKFYDYEDLIVVSDDRLFLTAITQKLPHAQTFETFGECADHLNKLFKEYDEVRNCINKEIKKIDEKIKEELKDAFEDFIPDFYVEELGIDVDVTNYDRKGMSDFYELDELMIESLELGNPEIKILNINTKEDKVTAEITFDADVRIAFRADDLDDLIEETHKTKYVVEVEIGLKSNEVQHLISRRIILNRDNLVKRNIRYNYFDFCSDDF